MGKHSLSCYRDESVATNVLLSYDDLCHDCMTEKTLINMLLVAVLLNSIIVTHPASMDGI